MKRTLILALALAPLLAACGKAGDPASNLDAVRMTENAQLDAFVAKDLRGITRIYHADAQKVMPDGQVFAGAEAISANFESLLADESLQIEQEQGAGWASASGDVAVTTSVIRLTTTDAETGDAATVAMRNQTAWQKPEGGTWSIVSDYNVLLPQAE